MDDSSQASLVAIATDEFLAELRLGKNPDIEGIVARFPQVAGVLRDILPALLALDASHFTAGSPEPTDPTPSLRQLGDFQLAMEVGRGGMGIVYEAWQVSLQRRVALKVLPFASALDARQLQRFKNEAQAAAQLHHTHIVPVYGVGAERGVHFYAMQFIEGHTLAALIEESRVELGIEPARTDATAPTLSQPEGSAQSREIGESTSDVAVSTQRSSRSRSHFLGIARLAAQAADALEHAHTMGIVHRDIKPGNLMVDVHGHLWVTDFGLAQIHGDGRLTMTGDLVGTLRYMSPEQLLGGRVLVDHRADIYSLGATLYELLVLEPAFAGRDRGALLRKITFEEPATPRRIDRSIPVELETIVLKAMAKNPTERYADARELAEDLGRFLRDEPIRARRPTPWQHAKKWARRHRGIVVTGGVLGVLLLAALAAGATIVAAQQRQLARTRADALYAQRQATRQAEGALLAADASFREAQQVVDDYLMTVSDDVLLRESGMQPLRRKLLERALGYYQRFVDQRGEDQQARTDLALAKLRIASIVQELESSASAAATVDEAANMLRELARTAPRDARVRRGLASALSLQAEVMLARGQATAARGPSDEALALGQQLVAESPDDGELVYRLAHDYRSRTTLESRFGDSVEGLRVTGEALAALDRVRPAAEHRRDLLRMRAVLLGDRGYFLDDLGRLDEALAARRRQVEIDEQLLGESPEDGDVTHDLANCLLSQSIIERRLGHAQTALATTRRAADLAAANAARNPNVTRFALTRATAQNNLADILRVLKQFDAAISAFQESAALRERLAQQYPEVAEYRRAQALVYANLGLVDTDRERFADAAAWHRRAIDILETLTKESPDFVQAHQLKAESYQALAMALLSMEQFSESEKAFEAALRERAELVGRHPERADLRAGLAGGYNDFGLLLMSTKRESDATEAYRKSIASYSQLVAEFPDNFDQRHNLSLVHYNLGLLERERGDSSAALACFRQSAGVMTDRPYEKPAAEFDRASYLALIAALLEADPQLTGESLVAERRRLQDEAVAALRRAIAAGYPDPVQLATVPDLAALRGHEGFDEVTGVNSTAE